MARRFWFGWIVVPIGVLGAAIAGLTLFMGRAAPDLHPDPQAISSVTRVVPRPQSAAAADKARQIVRASLSEGNLPGLSVAVGVGGEIVWAEGFGWADINMRVPVTPETRFWIGTASTTLTSAAVGALAEHGRLTFDDEIQTHVPEFPTKQWPVTLRQLMGNVAGVGTDDGNEGPLFRQRCERPVAALPHFADHDLLFEPQTQYRHSKYGWILVSAAIEAASGKPFLSAMREQIFAPLGMQDTGAESVTEENPDHIGEPSEDAPFLTLIQDFLVEPLLGGDRRARFGDRATFYSPGLGPDPVFRYRLHRMRTYNLSCYAGSMAFLSTPIDLVRFGLALNSGKLLPPATVQLLLTSQPLTSGKKTGHGLGWDLEAVSLAGVPTQAAGHNGELLGRGVMSFMMFPERGIVVALMANSSYADIFSLAVKIAEAFAEPTPVR